MKKFSLLFVCVLLSLTAAMSQKPLISFVETEYNFGKINEADGKVTHVFEFINKGNAPLVLSRVQTSCGCTTPNWTKEPIEPNKKGKVTVTFDTAGKSNSFIKTITVFSNDTVTHALLTIKGEVIPKSSK